MSESAQLYFGQMTLRTSDLQPKQLCHCDVLNVFPKLSLKVQFLYKFLCHGPHGHHNYVIIVLKNNFCWHMVTTRYVFSNYGPLNCM